MIYLIRWCIWCFVTIVVLHGATGIHLVRRHPRGEAGVGVPIRNVLVEGGGVAEHPCHVRDIGYLPAAVRRRVQRLVEQRGVAEHPAHKRDLVDPPVVQRLVKQMAVVEHLLRRRDAGNVPIADVRVEGYAVEEHSFHVRDAGHIPVVQI